MIVPHMTGQIPTRSELATSRAENLFPSGPPGVVVADGKVADFHEFCAIFAKNAPALVLLPLKQGLEESLADRTLMLKRA